MQRPQFQRRRPLGYAMKYCKEQGYHFPTEQQLADMANALYKGMSAITTSYDYTYAGKDTNNQYYRIGSNEPLPEALNGLGSSWYYLWSGSGSSHTANGRKIHATYSIRNYGSRFSSAMRAVCVGD